jgi:hypothetical protein
MSTKFFIMESGSRTGPHSQADMEFYIARGKVTPDTACQVDVETEWHTVEFYFGKGTRQPEPSVTALGLLSVLLVFGGIAALVYYMRMDTSVGNYGAGRVNNLGLMQDRQNGIIVSGLALLIGVLLALFGGKRK